MSQQGVLSKLDEKSEPLEIVGAPKYLVVYNRILSKIQRGLLKPGDQLQPELELARTMGVSLGTTQKALRLLADRGLVIRRQGHGTFVAGAPTPKNDREMRNFRFFADDDTTLLPIFTRVLVIEEIKDLGLGHIFPEEESLVRITRLVNVNLEFQMYCQLLLPANRFRMFLDFDVHDLDGTALTHYLGERCNIPVVRCTHRLRTVEIPPVVCEQIAVPLGTQGTEWQMYGYTRERILISYQHAYMPPHNRRLELRDPPG